MTRPLSGIDERLREWATAKEAEYMDAIALHGGASAAGRALGVHKSAVCNAIKALKKRAASKGYSPEHHMTQTVPEGFRVKGVSTYFDKDGNAKGQWVKSAADAERGEQNLRAFVEGLFLGRGDLAPITPPPERVLSDLLAVYAFGDPHFGMKASASAAGEDFDLAEADRITRAGIDRLVSVTPPTGTALLLNVGDNTHANDGSHKTPGHGNQMDMDGHHNDAVLVSAHAWAYAVRRMLEKHAKVIVWLVPGNHDPDASFAIAVALSMYFHNEPRVEVDVSRAAYRYLRFGQVLIGGSHGHGAKPGDLPLIMAVDRPRDWADAPWRYIFIGHIHHDTVKEVQGVRVESLRTLAAKDDWHARQGYRSLRDTRSIVYAANGGEVERHTASAALLSAA